MFLLSVFCFFQAEDGIRDLVRSRGLGDVYKRQRLLFPERHPGECRRLVLSGCCGEIDPRGKTRVDPVSYTHLTLPTSDLVEISVVAVSLKKTLDREQDDDVR